MSAGISGAMLATPALGAFPGTNGLIAYSTRPDAGSAHAAIYTMTAHGAQPTRLTPSDGSRNPSWSADGQRIAFERAAALHVMRSDGSDSHRVSTGGVRAYNPSWSPNGRKLVFEGCRGGGKCDEDHRAIFVVRAGGGGVKRLAGNGSDPVWSPKGKWIAYRGMQAKKDQCETLLRVKPSGRGRSAVLPRHRDAHGTCSWGGSGADFSPDGRRLVYYGLAATGSQTFPNPVGGTFKVWNYDVAMYTVGIDGKHRTLVATRSLKHAEWFLLPFAWSPDGHRLLWRDDRGVQTARPNGKQRHQVTAKGGDLVWQPIPRG